MEKGTKPNTSPPATACDVLRPLSSTGEFPTSGAVAAHAREQMATGGKSPSSSSSATQAGSPSQSATSNESADAVQRRKETVQQMREEDSNGVRTWRRLIVEYN